MREFTASRLLIARMKRGLTQKELAEKCGCTTQYISQLETSERGDPGPLFIDKLVFALGFTAKFFRGDEVDMIPPEAFSFRARRSRISKDVKDKVLGHGHLAFNVISNDLNQRFSLPSADIPDLSSYEPEDAAQILRGVWNLGSEPIGNMVRLLESKGVEIYWINEESPDLDAFSIWRDGKPFATLNSNKQAGDRSRFDAAHELGHLVLHRKVDDLTIAEVEKQANEFASAFLLPSIQFRHECPKELNFGALYRLKPRWKVAIQAMIMRGASLGIYSPWQKQNAFQRLNATGMRKKEDVPIPTEESKLHHLIFQAMRDSGLTPKEYALGHLGFDVTTLLEFMPVAAEYMDSQNPSSVPAPIIQFPRSPNRSSRSDGNK